MPKLKFSQIAKFAWLSISFGFLVSLISVIGSIAISIGDPGFEMPLEFHFATWFFISAISFAVLILKSRP